MISTLVLMAALPTFSEPALVLDLDARPSLLSPARLLGGTDAGVLFSTRKPNGNVDSRLWWWAFGARATSIGDTGPDHVAARVGNRFILLDEKVASSVDVEAADITVTPLVTGSAQLVFGTSTSPTVMFFDGEKVWTTDGTVAGTTSKDLQLAGAAFETQGRIGGFTASDSFSVWDAAGNRTLALGDATSAGVTHGVFVFGGTRLRNEAGEVLVDRECSVRNGGWAICAAADGGRDLVSTDGTLLGTRLRAEAVVEIAGVDDERVAWNSNESGTRRANLLDGFEAGSPVPLVGPCFPGDGFRGNFLACTNAVFRRGNSTPVLSGEFVQQSVVAGDGLVVKLMTGLVVTGATGPFTSVGLEFDETRSSSPVLLSTNGETALYRTQTSDWLTDGTTAGTTALGWNSIRWGRGAVGFSIGAVASSFDSLSAYDAHAQPIPLPAGLQGVAGSWIVGHVDCSVLRFDEARQEKRIEVPEKCIERLDVFNAGDAAFLTVNGGEVFLVRGPFEPFSIGVDIERSVAPRCAAKRCWFAAQTAGGLTLRSVALASREITDEAVVQTTGGFFEKVTDDVALFSTVLAVGTSTLIKWRDRPDPFTYQIAPTWYWQAVSANLDVFLLDEEKLRVVDRSGVATDLADCRGVDLKVVGDSFFAACSFDDSTSNRVSYRLITGSKSEFREIYANAQQLSTIGVDGELVWISAKLIDGTSELVVRSGNDTRLVSADFADQFAAVRAGVVFAMTRKEDRELWGISYERPPAKCGCTSGFALTPLALLALWLRRALRLRDRAAGRGAR